MLDAFRLKIAVCHKSAGRRSGAVVLISTFVRESHGKFNERSHELYAKRAMTSVQEKSARTAFKNIDSILVSTLVLKRKRSEA